MAQLRDETGIILGVLNAVESDAAVSQRRVAKDLGIALGLANAYVRRCIKKGLIKAQQVPANRLTYYLTPQGFAEKSRLAAEYLSQGLQFFRVARDDMDQVYKACEQAGYSRVVLHGLTDLTEIAVLSARDHSVTIVAIVDNATTRVSYGGIRISRELPDLQEFDAVVITDLNDSQQGFEAVAGVLHHARILVPAILHVSRTRPQLVG
jgi:DNA-binding MarR family transcriptional regulator